MSRKMVCLAFGVVLLLSVGALTVLVLLVRHEPDFYRRAYLAPGKPRRDRYNEFVAKNGQFVSNITNEEKKWDAEFTQDQINSFLAEDFASPDNVDKNFPGGIHDPRIAIDADTAKFAFRYGTAPWCTIVSLELKVWLAAREANVVAVELESLKAGSLPITAQSILDRFSETLRQRDVEVTWYRHEGKPVMLLRFQAGKKPPTLLLRNLKLQPGRLQIGVGSGSFGGSEEPTRASLTPESVKPLGN